MQDNIITKSFEHLQIQKLPKRAHRIISSVVKRHSHASGKQLTAKQLELAAALLRMKLYQAFGSASNEYIEPAIRDLVDKLQGTTSSSTTTLATKVL